METITLNPNKWYKPRVIAQNRWITNSKDSPHENSNYWFILKLINTHQLKARDFGRGDKPYYLVLGSEIERYMRGD